MPNQPDVMEKLVSLSKRRGFIFQSSEIYGGTGSVWDYGPLGVELKRNLQERWWKAMVRSRSDIEGLDSAILMHPRVWEASGHVGGFVDPLVDCQNCKKRFRADDPRIKGTPGTPDAQCPACGMKGTLSEARQFNLMFKTFMGPAEDTASIVYLRPETAQGTYVNFLNVQQSTRQRIAVWHRADRQGVPQRDHAGQLHFPHARVRADGDAVLRRARHRHEVVRVLEGAADGLAPVLLGLPKIGSSSINTLRMSWRTTRARRSTFSSTSAARSASRRSREFTTAVTSISRSIRNSRARSSSISITPPTSATCHSSWRLRSVRTGRCSRCS